MIKRITNYELRITNKGRKFLSLFIILYSLFFILGSANAWVITDPLVPCGGVDRSGAAQPACTQCELLHLVDNLMDFILIAAAPILATFFFIIAGLYIMLGGARPDMLATGKRMFTSALVGIIIVMLAWLVTNTLITTLIAPTVSQKLPSGGTFTFDSANWFDVACGRLNLKDTPPGTGGGGLAPPRSTVCNPACPSGQVCWFNSQNQPECVTVPSLPPGYTCDPITNIPCSVGQTCFLNPQNLTTSCQ